MPTPPPLTQEQRRKAYEKALELRQERALLKQAVRLGAVAFQDAWGYDVAQGMKVYDLLLCLHWVGKAKALNMMNQASIPERNTIKRCGPKQTDRLFSQVQAMYDAAQRSRSDEIPRDRATGPTVRIRDRSGQRR